MVSFHANGTSTEPEKSAAASRPKETPELRSDEVQEILGQMPGWTVRWGITVIFSIVVMLLLASWFVKYPDTIRARVVLTTEVPPASLISRAEGPLKLYVRDNQVVRRGDYLAMLENPAHLADIHYLNKKVARFRTWRYQTDKTTENGDFREDLVLGELQTAYAAFLSSRRDYQRSKRLLSHDKQIKGLQSRIQQYQRMNEQLEKQQHLLAEELKLSHKRFATDKKLFEEAVLAEQEFDQSKTTLLQAERTVELAQGNIINNQIMLSQLRTQVTELEVEKSNLEGQLQNNVENTLKTLESQLDTWEQRYLLQTPIAGKVAFVKYRSDNQFVRSGEEVMTVVPDSDELYGQVLMPVAGSGKASVGQPVNIRFDNYPATEYGTVAGKVAAISPVPREGHYLIRVQLPRGLTTSYQKKLAFKQEMQGNAEIITDDLRLIERIFNQFRNLLDKATR
ncbi:MAG: HlyD family efflux transporter periplasmic adaptor subunit [Ferruginibacter sp.]|nr:HlyD family efflux transporter periplasmic adaptor subunit [Cytophagales bacterium]